MAVSEMKKLSAVVMKDDTERLIAALQKLCCVEISETDTSDGTLAPTDTKEASETLTRDIATAKRAVEFLMQYDCTKYSMFDAPKTASIDDFDSGLDAVTLGEAKTACALSDRMAKLKTQAADEKAALEALEPWEDWDVALPEDVTRHTVTLGGTLSANADITALSQKLGEYACIMQTVQNGGRGQAVVSVSAHKDDIDDVKRILAQTGFSKCTAVADKASGYAAGVIRQKKERIASIEKELGESVAKAKILADRISDIKALCDMLETRKKRLEAKESMAETGKTTVISGWVPAAAQKKVENLLEGRDAAYEFEDPGEDDDVPVVLSNNRFASNFEPIVSMYALPLYGKFDPTMLVSVFYTVIFGLMLADAGYGLIILLGCLAGLKLLHPKESMAKLLKMFAICGVSCIVAGVLFGGYFGDLPNAIREGFGGAKDLESPAILFDMVDEPMMFLVVSLAIGAVHMICGMLVQFVELCKSGHVFDAIADVGSWLIVFAGIGVLAAVNMTAGAAICGVGALMLICTQGRHEKNIFMKFAKGVLSLYDIVSYASDLLSYSRILALGLASAVIASVVNLLATMGGVSVPGMILFVFVFLVGHIINLLVNLLGTYVHTSRLQYIEFFGKFYESGGREFSPLSPEMKYVNLK